MSEKIDCYLIESPGENGVIVDLKKDTWEEVLDEVERQLDNQFVSTDGHSGVELRISFKPLSADELEELREEP